MPFLSLVPLILLTQHSSGVLAALPLQMSSALTFDLSRSNVRTEGYSFLAAPESTEASGTSVLDLRDPDGDQTGPPPQAAFEYSHGYEVRLRIHRYSSYAMLPVFAAEAIVGEKLLHNPLSRGLKTAHAALNVGVFGLFTLDSVTGIWNLKEGWQDPHGRVRRLAHALLMLTADGGFLASALTAPHSRQVAVNTSVGSTHRNIAIASISVATAGYLIMVFR